MSAGDVGPNPLPANTSGDGATTHVPQHVPAAPDDPDLARIIAAWPTLAEPIRRAIMALVESADLCPGATGT
jgi:hypothetical protein